MSSTAAQRTLSDAGPQVIGPQTRRLKKGELLFAEGENSRAMYYLKSGMIRIYKKKGDSCIEIDTIRSGQILGELAFLDGNPRSASGEALTDCELMEVSGPTFQAVINSAPEWLKLLLKTIVGRLRSASTRIRQLESASAAYETDKDGKRSVHYVYLSVHDLLKLSTATLLVSARHGRELRFGLLQRYANQILNIPAAKITTYLDLLGQVGVARLGTEGDGTLVTLEDPDFLEAMILYFADENLLEPSKRHDVSLKGFVVMSLMAKHLERYPKDPETGISKVNIAEIRKLETPEGGKEPFRLDDFPELVKLGYCTSVHVKDGENIFSSVKPESFLQQYRFQRVALALNAVNEQKRKGAK